MKKPLIKVIFALTVAGVIVAAHALIDKNTDSVSSTNTTGGVPASLAVEDNARPASGCIVTIDGSRYDVESLRSTHPGGDIFECGTDMSAAFHAQHGASLEMISEFIVNK